MRCAHCNRPLKHAPGPHGMGPTCERNLFGAKPAAIQTERHVSPDERQAELFPHLWQRVQSAARRLHVWLGGAA